MCYVLLILFFLGAVNSQLHIGDLYFPVTVASPENAVEPPDRTDTIYDEPITIVEDSNEKLTAAEIKAYYEKDQNEKWKMTKKLPPVYYSMWKMFKPLGLSYKTDAEVTPNEPTENDYSILPTNETFVTGTGIALVTSPPIKQPIGKEPVIEMSVATIPRKEIPITKKKSFSFSMKPSKTKEQNKVVNIRTPKIILAEYPADSPHSSNKDGQCRKVLDNMEEKVNRLTREITKMKIVVNKLIRRVFHKNKRSHPHSSSFHVEEKEHLVARQSIPNPSNNQFIHTWNRNPHLLLRKGSSKRNV